MSDPVQLEEKSESKKSKSQVSKQSSNKPQSIKQSEKNSINNNDKKQENIENDENKSHQQVLSTRAYLEQNVVQVVQEALLECARKRPNNPLEFVGNYILNHPKGK